MKINKEKVTRELCETNRVIFFPKTQEESAFIQRKLFDLGYTGVNGSKTVFTDPALISKGLTPSRGTICHPASEDKSGYLVCTYDQFGDGYTLSVQERELLLEKFNALAARLEAIERKQGEILAELRPKRLDKGIAFKGGD